MKKTILYLLLGVSVCLSACGGKGKANRDKEIQDSIRKADSLAKVAVWQKFITPLKEIKFEQFRTPENIVEMTKEQVKVLEPAGFLTPTANKFWSFGKATLDKFFIVHFAEKYNERTETMGGEPTVIYDTKCYLLTFDKNGSLLDKLFIETANPGGDTKATETVRFTAIRGKNEALSIATSVGIINSNQDFIGEKTTYKIEDNGMFKEVSRKKEKYTIMGD